MLVSLFTDASFCHRTCAGGWGAFIACERGKRYGGGQIEEYCKDSSHAELLAVRYGLRFAAERKLLRPKDEILLQTDSLTAMEVMETFAVRTRIKEYTEVHDRIRKGLMAWENKLRVRHIKGHSGTGTSRTYVHNKCDRLAHEGMRKARIKLQGKLPNAAAR